MSLVVSHTEIFLHSHTFGPPDVKNETIELSNESLLFKGTSGEKEYSVNIEFLNAVNAEGSTYKVLPRSVQMLLKKLPNEEDGGDEGFWPRLLKDKALEKNQVKIDWDRYVDEDEEEEGFDTSALEGGMGMGGMPGMGGMGGMPGMGGMGGMDMDALMKQMGNMGGGELDDAGDAEDDEDDEGDLPPLESVE